MSGCNSCIIAPVQVISSNPRALFSHVLSSILNNIRARAYCGYQEKDRSKGLDLLGIEIGQTDFRHCRVRSTK